MIAFLKLKMKPTLTLSRTKYIREGAITLTVNSILCSYLASCKCCCQRKPFNKLSRQQNHDRLYDKGVTKLNLELDCVEFIKSKRKLNLLTKVILNESQQMLANFASDQILDTSKKLPKKIDSGDTLSSAL